VDVEVESREFSLIGGYTWLFTFGEMAGRSDTEHFQTLHWFLLDMDTTPYHIYTFVCTIHQIKKNDFSCRSLPDEGTH